MFDAGHHHRIGSKQLDGFPVAGLHSYYNFIPNPAYDQRLYDSSGHNRYGRLGDSVVADATDPAWVGNSLYFEPQAWVYLLSPGGVPTPLYQTNFSLIFALKAAAQSDVTFYCDTNAGSDDPHFRLATGTADTAKLRVSIRTAPGTVQLSVESTATVFDGDWHLVGYTDEGGTYAIYVDGETADTGSYSHASPTFNRSVLGILMGVGISGQFTGTLGQLVRWSRALSAAEYSLARAALKTRLLSQGIALP